MSRSASRFALHAVVFLFPLLVGVAAGMWVITETDRFGDAGLPPDQDVRVRPQIDPALPTAIIALGSGGVESSELIAPFGILAESHAMNVITAAGTRALLPVRHGVDVIPDVEFSRLEGLLVGRAPAVIVIPTPADPSESELVEWVRAQSLDSTMLIAGGNGVRVLAQAGFLAGREAAAARDIVDRLRRDHPGTAWRSDVPIVEDGATITTAGGLTAMDAAVRAIARVAGDSIAASTADRLGIEPAGGGARSNGLDAADYAALYLVAGFVWDKRDVAVGLFDGASELALGAILDVFPHVYDADVLTAGLVRRPYATRNGLRIVPRLGLDDEPKIHEMVFPGEPSPEELRIFLEVAAEEEIPAYNPFGGVDSTRIPYEVTLSRIAVSRSDAVSGAVSKLVRYPKVVKVGAWSWPRDVIALPLIFGLLALFVLRLARKRRHA